MLCVVDANMLWRFGYGTRIYCVKNKFSLTNLSSFATSNLLAISL